MMGVGPVIAAGPTPSSRSTISTRGRTLTVVMGAGSAARTTSLSTWAVRAISSEVSSASTAVADGGSVDGRVLERRITASASVNRWLRAKRLNGSGCRNSRRRDGGCNR